MTSTRRSLSGMSSVWMNRPTPWHASASCRFPNSTLRVLCDSNHQICRNFGPSLVPLLQVGWRGVVQTDAGFRAHLTTVQNHKDTCSHATWETMLTYAKKLRGNKTKIAFFSST